MKKNRLSIEIEEEKMKSIKIICAKNGKSIKETITKLIDDFIKSNNMK